VEVAVDSGFSTVIVGLGLESRSTFLILLTELTGGEEGGREIAVGVAIGGLRAVDNLGFLRGVCFKTG